MEGSPAIKKLSALLINRAGRNKDINLGKKKKKKKKRKKNHEVQIEKLTDCRPFVTSDYFILFDHGGKNNNNNHVVEFL